MRMGENVVYRYQNTVRVGRWVHITENHKAVIQSFHKGNASFVIRSMNQIHSLADLINKYGLGTPKTALRESNWSNWVGTRTKTQKGTERP